MGSLPITRVWKLFEHWAEFPPQHQLLRAWVGYKGASKVREQQNKVEAVLMNNGPVKNFTQLPPSVKEWLESVPKADA